MMVAIKIFNCSSFSRRWICRRFPHHTVVKLCLQKPKTLAQAFCQFAQQQFSTSEFIPLHIPTLNGNEEAYVVEAIRSTFVSTVGQKVVDFEQQLATFLGVKYAIAMVNGTAALHIALLASGESPIQKYSLNPCPLLPQRMPYITPTRTRCLLMLNLIQ